MRCREPPSEVIGSCETRVVRLGKVCKGEGLYLEEVSSSEGVLGRFGERWERGNEEKREREEFGGLWRGI